jgi:hypothetical protein
MSNQNETPELAELQALSVTNIMLDVVPGDGDGHEVYAKSVADVEAALTKQYDESEELQATIARLTAENEAVKFNLDKTDKRYLAAVAEIERLKGGQGEPVAVECTSCDGSGEYIDAIGDWRGYCSCSAGVTLKERTSTSSSAVQLTTKTFADAIKNPPKLVGKHASENLDTASQPAPVSVVMPERLTAAELEELEVIEVLLHGQGLSNLAGTMAAARQFIDEIVCLDAPTRTLRLPERKPIEALSFNWTTADVENTGWNACLDKAKELNQ